MKILLLGSKGMLGSSFKEKLSLNTFGEKNIDLVTVDKDDLDITNEKALGDFFQGSHYDFVINCSAYTDVDGAETNKDLALKVNGEALAYLAKICQEKNTILIHFSTDYVFDGEKVEGYAENDQPNPLNVYGRSKLIGEENIQKYASKFYIIRTSWLFGHNGKNFVNTMIDLRLKKQELKVVNDQFGSPTYTNDLAEAVIANFIKNRPDFGIFHLTNSEKCSWYDFSRLIFELTESKIEVIPISSDKLERPARRPKNSLLINTKLSFLRPFSEALKEYLKNS